MEIVMILSMMLFTGFCTLILVIAMFNVAGKKGDKPSLSDTTTQTSPHDRETLV